MTIVGSMKGPGTDGNICISVVSLTPSSLGSCTFSSARHHLGGDLGRGCGG